MAKSLKNRLHAHGCTKCSRFYQDACASPDVNARCASCITGNSRPLWDRNRDPIDCCRSNSKLAAPHVRLAHSLAGDGEWWRCKACSRTHPYDPTRPEGATP